MKRKNLTILPYEAPKADLLLVRTEQNFLASKVNSSASSRGYSSLYDIDDALCDDEWGLN